MASKIRRRSGNAVVEYCRLLEWDATSICMVGLGSAYEEVECFREEWPDVELWAFEPHPALYDAAVKTFPGRLHACGISDRRGSTILYSKKRGKSGASLFPKADPKEDVGIHKIKVPCTTLDFVFSDALFDRGLLWLDCEGSELDAMRGGERFISKNIQVINIEMTGRPRGIGWCSIVDTHNWLSDHGFGMCWIHTTRSVRGQFDAIYVRRELIDPSICVSPNEIQRKLDEKQ